MARKDRETGRASEIVTDKLFDELNELEEIIVRYLYNSGPLTPKKTAEIIDRSGVTVRKIMNNLMEKQIVVMHGSGPKDPKKYYTLKGNL